MMPELNASHEVVKLVVVCAVPGRSKRINIQTVLVVEKLEFCNASNTTAAHPIFCILVEYGV